MKTIGIDLLADGKSHCLYHIGMLEKKLCDTLHLKASSEIKAANEVYTASRISLDSVRFHGKYGILFFTILMLLKRQRIVFVGIKFWQLLMLGFLIAFNGNVTIHMHGQAVALKSVGFKYYVWRAIALFVDLCVSNAAWAGPDFVKIITHVMILDDFNRGNRSDGNLVIYYSAIQRRLNDEFDVGSILEEKGYRISSLDGKGGMVDFKVVDEFIRSARFMYMEFPDDYYLYSPSGRMSDAVNYGVPILIRKNDLIAKKVADHYGADYVYIEDLAPRSVH